MNITEFAREYNLRTKKDEEDETIIECRYGHLWDYGDGKQLGVFVTSGRKWAQMLRAAERVGIDIYLDCEGEGMALFDAWREDQAQVVIELMQPRKKRRMSDEQKAEAAARLAKYREESAA